MNRSRRVAALVLAGGGSRRLGQPKQLISFDGVSLVRLAVLRALESSCDRVFVVVGAYPRRILAALSGLEVHPVENPRWETGMGSSIGAAILALQDHPLAFTAAMITTVDQYRIGSEHLNRLRDAHDAGHDLVASDYAGSLGIPALFSERYFPELLRIDPARGAKAVLAERRDRVLSVPCSEGCFDLDTQYDLDAFNRQTNV